jgi:hypothetical protein
VSSLALRKNLDIFLEISLSQAIVVTSFAISSQGKRSRRTNSHDPQALKKRRLKRNL